MADGRAVLRSSIREYLCSEAMHALGVPTTRALSIIGSDAPVRRETIETSAVVTRLAPSFIRFGHFEHFRRARGPCVAAQLADFVIDRFYPPAGTPRIRTRPCCAKCPCTADMVAHWQAVGFCHGVMNTDNMSILGLTIDYGPFGFLDAFDANHICNHSDQQGRYAYSQQPQIAFWNLHCLAQALLPLWRDANAADPEVEKAAAVEAAREALDPFRDRYAEAFFRHYRAKLGLRAEQEQDETLMTNLFRVLHENRVDTHCSGAPFAVSSLDNCTTHRCATCSSIARPGMRGQLSTAPGCRASSRTMRHARPPCWPRIRNTSCATIWPRRQSAPRATRISPKWTACWPCCRSHSTNSPKPSHMQSCRPTGPPA
jgi:uncharacterized protein YdiU (UPF0061 family)